MGKGNIKLTIFNIKAHLMIINSTRMDSSVIQTATNMKGIFKKVKNKEKVFIHGAMDHITMDFIKMI